MAKPGDYLIEATVAPASSMATYVPTSLTTTFAVAAMDMGFDVDRPDMMKGGRKITTNGFSVPGVKEVYIDCAADLASVASVWKMDGVALNAYGFKTAESFVQDRLGSTSIYGIYQTSDTPSTLNLELSTATTTAFITYN
jgi:hypothetical protein